MQALAVLSSRLQEGAGSLGGSLERLVEGHACQLLEASLAAAVDAFLRIGTLDPVRLLPALVGYHHAHLGRLRRDAGGGRRADDRGDGWSPHSGNSTQQRSHGPCGGGVQGPSMAHARNRAAPRRGRGGSARGGGVSRRLSHNTI